MLKKIVKIISRIIIGIFVICLFLVFVVIPFGMPWLIKWQGSKLLAHPMQVRSVWFNPIAMRVTINGLKILDADKQLMVGFDKFWANASFISLLKKQYRVESFGIDGLNVNVVLLPDNQINLMALVPKQAQAPAQGQPSQPKLEAEKPESAGQLGKPAQPQISQPLPVVFVDSIILKNGKVTFTDNAIAPGFTTRLSAMEMNVTGISTLPDCQVRMVFKSNLDEKGTINIEALVKPFVQPLQMEATFSLNNYAMRALSPYVGKYTGSAVKEGGKLDVRVDYRIEDNKLVAGHKVLIQRFNFGEKVESKDALSLPFGLAIALLEDPQERIDVSLPVHGDIADPKFEYFHLLGQVAVNFFMKLVTAPFKVLFALVPSAGVSTEEMGTISFAPGASVLADAEKQKVEILAKALKERPKLSLEINGSYDAEADWKAMKTQAFEDEFAARLKETSFGDFRVYEDMYRLQFGVRTYWALAHKYTQGKKIDEEALKAEIKRQIIEKGAPDKIALEAMAQKRAQLVYDLLIASGFDSARVTLGAVRKTQISMGQVPLEFTLTVFEDAKASEEPANK
jgi:hypothetical protein